jgi:hypothetical protein
VQPPPLEVNVPENCEDVTPLFALNVTCCPLSSVATIVALLFANVTAKATGCPDAEQFELVKVFATTAEIVADFDVELVVFQSVMNCSGPPSIVFRFVSLLAMTLHCPVDGACANAALDKIKIPRTKVEIFTFVLPVVFCIHPSRVSNATACPFGTARAPRRSARAHNAFLLYHIAPEGVRVWRLKFTPSIILTALGVTVYVAKIRLPVAQIALTFTFRWF